MNKSYSLATVSNTSFISEFGYSGLPDASGLTLSQAHLSFNSSVRLPSSIWMTYLPRTGKNLNP